MSLIPGEGLFSSIVETAGGIISKLVKDKDLAGKLTHEFNVKMLESKDGLLKGQMEVNKAEAQHASIFVAGWRPAVGWICGIALGWNFILQPVLLWAVWLFPNAPELATAPTLDTGELMTVLLGMLGLGGLRTFEKHKGVDRKNMRE